MKEVLLCSSISEIHLVFASRMERRARQRAEKPRLHECDACQCSFLVQVPILCLTGHFVKHIGFSYCMAVCILLFKKERNIRALVLKEERNSTLSAEQHSLGSKD